MRWKLFRPSQHALALVFALFLMALMPVGPLLAQQLRALGMPPPVPVLQLHTYADNWLRYGNIDENDAPKLAVEDRSQFPFRYALSVFPLGLDEWEDPATTLRLFEQYNLEYNESPIDGYCYSEKLSSKSTDVICVPGPCDMPDGYVFLALYHPDNSALLALTTTIDNADGVAARASTCPVEQVEQAASETDSNAGVNGESPLNVEVQADSNERVNGEAQASDNPQDKNQAQSCGPYAAGQWINEDDYAASGLDLPIVMDALASQITDYQCVVPDDGESPYLLGYSILPPQSLAQAPSSQESSKKPSSSKKPTSPKQSPCECLPEFEGLLLRDARKYEASGKFYCDCCYGDGRKGYIYQIDS